MPAPNFTQCAVDFLTNKTNIERYAYHGPVRGIVANSSTQITYDGCLALCGSGSAYYDWYAVSNTILTWVLPVLGIILQAPYEPHAVWSTVRHRYLSRCKPACTDKHSVLRSRPLDWITHGLSGLLTLEYQRHQHVRQDRMTLHIFRPLCAYRRSADCIKGRSFYTHQ